MSGPGFPRKAMLLAAGLGERLRPLTQVKAKPALRYVDEPLIRRNLRWLARSGVKEVVVNLHHLPETVRAAVGDPEALGLKVHWSEETEEILGTAGGLGKARDFFAGEDAFFLVNGDSVQEAPLQAAFAAHEKAAADGAVATLVLMPSPDLAEFRPVEIDGKERVRRVRGEPAGAEGDLRPMLFTGIHVLTPRFLDAIPPGVSDTNGDVYPKLLREGALVASCGFQGFWRDLGTPARYLEASTAEVKRRGLHSWIARDARVHAMAVVLEGSVVGSRARVEEGAEVRGAIVLDGAYVGMGAWVEGSIVGEGTRIEGGEIFGGRVRCRVGREIVEREVGA